MPSESPAYCQCDLPHTMAEEAVARDAANVQMRSSLSLVQLGYSANAVLWPVSDGTHVVVTAK